ncbi:hypothetical protein FRX31_010038 [Thalictrum thalictroides]|uniref:MORF/ORRM1/DAG-like MORF domain-containing protein n=1 Tax=Thalictrum thalictroides TaxID=46969 RepID=A0A7J6WSM4_THATH|nr:hypothetical protein FRX31_010038 [Thalictrum thalictroides]
MDLFPSHHYPPGSWWFTVIRHLSSAVWTPQRALFDFYIKSLATVVGNEAEALNKTYLVSVVEDYDFGVEIDRYTKDKLIGTIQMQNLPNFVFEGLYYGDGARKKDPNNQSSL